LAGIVNELEEPEIERQLFASLPFESYERPRCGRSQDRRSNQRPSRVLQRISSSRENSVDQLP